jgi:sugar diacid utilization regulator
MWLKSIYAMQDRKILNIIDTLDLLIVSSNGWDNYNNIFSYYHKKLQTYHYTEEFLQLADVLIQHNMNYAQAAKVLFVHKNTIVFRMNKLKSILGIDPYANQDHLALFSYLYYYISLDNHTLLSFQKEYDKYRS